MTVAAAEREREAAERAMRARVSEVTRDLVLVPTGAEIAQYERFRRELAVASAVLSRTVLPARLRAPEAPALSLVGQSLRSFPPQSEDRGAPFGSRVGRERANRPSAAPSYWPWGPQARSI